MGRHDRLPAGEQTVFVRNDDTTPHQFVVAGSTMEVRAWGTTRQAVRLPEPYPLP